MKNKSEINFYYKVNLSNQEKKFFNKLNIIFSDICNIFFKNKLNLNHKFIIVSFHLCGDYKIKKLNQSFRNRNKRTDVLSFSLFEDLRNEVSRNRELLDGPAINLGDVYICKNIALSQAQSMKISWKVEFLHLWVHGFLHLCGFDHERSVGEEAVMFDLEDKLVKKCLKAME